MLLESFTAYKNKAVLEKMSNSSEELDKLTDTQLNIVYFLIFTYVFVTIYVAIKYPIGGNLVLSLVLAIFFSTLFWFIKIIEVIFFSSKEIKRKIKTRRAKKNNKTNKKGKKYYQPIY